MLNVLKFKALRKSKGMTVDELAEKTVSGCAKEETRTYMFWWDFFTANNLQDDGITRLYFYVVDY